MGGFSTQNWSQRMQIAGDWAEDAFREYAKEHNLHVERFGFDRSKLPFFYKLPRGVKSTPDFAVTSHKRDNGFLVECKGVGAADFVKIKKDDIIGLRMWLNMSEVFVFIYERIRLKQRYCMLSVEQLVDLVTTQSYKENSFDDGKVYYEIPKADLEWVVMNDRPKETKPHKP